MTRKHYTKPVFADALMGFITSTPAVVLDPCCGDGALLAAALKRWPGTTLAGIEKLQFAVRTAQGNIPDATVSKGNAFTLPWTVGPLLPDLIVCNPPFHGESRRPFRERADFAFFDKAFKSVLIGGTILLVLPFSVAANPSFRLWRHAILADFALVAAVDLPWSAFEMTDAAAVAIILRRGEKGLTRFVKLDGAAKIVKEMLCKVDDTRRFDAHHYLSKDAVPRVGVPTLPLADFIHRLRRGRYVAPNLRSASGSNRFVGLPELSGSSRQRFCTRQVSVNAAAGDIILSRVGRRAGMDVMFVNEENGVVANDCAFILTPKHLGGYVAAALGTSYVRAQMLAVRRGMTAHVLSKDALLSIRIPVVGRGQMTTVGRRWINNPAKRDDLLRNLDQQIAADDA